MTSPPTTFQRISAPRYFSDPADGLGPGPIVIIGAGLAGLFTALKLAPHPVTVISPTRLGDGASSAWAQGGIAAAVGDADTARAHAKDTIAAGGTLVDHQIAHMAAEDAAARVEDLLRLGVPFDRDAKGRFLLSREAAHSANRIVRVSGDCAGAAIMATLIKAVCLTPSIRVVEGFTAEDLRVRAGRITGVVLRAPDKTAVFLSAAAIVLATGGVGALYRVTTNPAHARGASLAMAARAGAAFADVEFVQFHPTALDVGLDPAPLATESLRGEGATLINNSGRRFLLGVHADAELAPRDIVARAVFDEIQAGRGAFLDCRKAAPNFATRFPTFTAHCKRAGLNPARAPIPIAPAAHYHMGGIATDDRARSTVTGLWAIGETASTGLHGANRLASNSLLECLVFASRAATDIADLHDDNSNAHEMTEIAQPDASTPRDIASLKSAMATSVGVIRNAAGLQSTLDELDRLEAKGAANPATANALTAARLITSAALERTESRGAHARCDYPHIDARYGERIYFKLESAINGQRPAKPSTNRHSDATREPALA